MSDLELDVEILFPEANFNSHIEKGTIEMSDEYFNLLQEKMARLISENQELKKQQEEFLELLEGMHFETEDKWWLKILEKYKEIIGVEDEQN